MRLGSASSFARCRCRLRSDVLSAVVVFRCGDKVGEQITGDQTWRFTDREVSVDLLPFCEMFRHFLRALPLELSSEGLEVVA